MSSSNRPRARNSALSGQSPVRPPEPTPEVTPEPEPTPIPVQESPEPTRPEQKTRTAKPKSAPATPAGTFRMSMYITPEEHDSAKSGYLADFQAGGHADTFSRWIAEVIDAHAARTVDERARLAQNHERASTRTGASRSFQIPTDVIERMRAAITADQAAGRWTSDSAWCTDAIAAAVDRARQRAGGSLPTPPARLPNRLRR